MKLNEIEATIVAAYALNDIINEELEEAERLEQEEARRLEEEQTKVQSVGSGGWSKEDQENFELSWHSLGRFDLNGEPVDAKPNNDFLEFA